MIASTIDALVREGLEAVTRRTRVQTLHWVRDLLTDCKPSEVASHSPRYTTVEVIQKIDEAIRNA